MQQRIMIDPQICHGNPCVANHRIPVAMVLELIAEGISFEEISAKYYPTLTRDDIAACVLYARHLIEPQPLSAACGLLYRAFRSHSSYQRSPGNAKGAEKL